MSKISGVPAAAAPIVSKAQLLLQLAERCEREEPSQDLDECIWSNIAGDDFAFETAPHLTTSLDAARSISNWLLTFASDIGAAGLPRVVLGNPGTGRVVEGSGGRTLELTWCSAALRALASLQEETK